MYLHVRIMYRDPICMYLHVLCTEILHNNLYFLIGVIGNQDILSYVGRLLHIIQKMTWRMLNHKELLSLMMSRELITNQMSPVTCKGCSCLIIDSTLITINLIG